MKKFAVVLSGSGVFDGAEIHEATLTLYAIMKNGGKYEIFAPDIDQHHVINHITGEEMKEKRNVLVESARIARGEIKALRNFNANDFDAIIFPGGFGVAKNLSSFAFDGADCSVNQDVERVILDMVKALKPIGALCISPAVIAKVLEGAELTIGNDKATAETVEKMGAIHKTTTHGEVVVDEGYKLVTTPCYMLDATILHIADGANNVVKTMMKMI
ncbi:MAG: isoprenoid biosynthesis glyoxalase ElbB [Bacteroidales bacterium]|nr:isoprenoid biosynthesis glyoxalase ElbB [Bacteroidales bacterium]MBN2756611.1 isoprenoid biosynthesis glyoxalase ElbB [Bacteroidales bacterium]